MDQITARKLEFFCLWLPEDKVKSHLINFNEGLYVLSAMNINEHRKTLKVISCNTDKCQGLFLFYIPTYFFIALPHIASRIYSGPSLFDLPENRLNGTMT